MASAPGNGMFVVTQYITAGNPIPVQQGSVMAEPPPFLQTFIKGEPKALGAVQIMIGVIHVILGGILCSLQYLPISIYSGVVFWGATSFFVSGGLSVAAAARKKGDTCLVRGSLGMNIVSAIVAGIAFIIYLIDLAAPPYFDYFCSSFYSSYNPRPCPTVSTTTVRLQKGILAALLILSILEFCISISTSAFGCKSICKCHCEGCCYSGCSCCACCSQAEPQSAQPVFIMQNANPQDPRCHTAQTMGIPVVQGMPVTQMMPATHGVVQGISTGQGMRTPYEGPMAHVNAYPPAAASPPREAPPSYSKAISEDVH